jgi:glutathione S-transferase
MTHLPALVAVLAVVILFWTIGLVAFARSRHKVKAPATSGPVEFERVYRAQANSIEATVMFLPALWVSTQYWNPTWTGYIGIVWLVGRVVYVVTYSRGLKRSPGFFTAFIANIVLVVTALIGVISAMMRVA